MYAETRITPLTPDDWPAVRAIYAEAIATAQATFATAAPDWPVRDAARLACCRLAARREPELVGWATLGPVSARSVYQGVAEVSVYVAAAARGHGVGRALLMALVEASEAAGLWTLQASIFPENAASLALHVACGFRVAGRRQRIAQHHGLWRDTLLLERRSERVGL